MSKSQFLMYKDIPVAEIQGFDVDILDFDRLPFMLKTKDLDFDMIFHGWTEFRIMNIGRTNSKALTASLGVSQNNMYAIGKLLHFTQFTDCYWLKSENEDLTWKDVSPYQNSFKEQLSRVSITGEQFDLSKLVDLPHLHSPELGAQGMTAKCLVKDNDDLYLYKVARKEIASSQILDELEIPHVQYKEVSKKRFSEIATAERMDKIKSAGEAVAECKIISSEKTSLLSWEEFCAFCDYEHKNEYLEMFNLNNSDEFYLMNIADYILNNDDRHGSNWGFNVDNESNTIKSLHPLMDHDHAFKDEDVKCQTIPGSHSLLSVAEFSAREIGWNPDKYDLSHRPDYISDDEYDGVKYRLNTLRQRLKEHQITDKDKSQKNKDSISKALQKGMFSNPPLK